MSTTMTPAAPSPAPEAPAQAVIPKSGSPEYATWRTTGKVPEPKAADPASATETPAEGVKPEDKPAPASEPGDKQERRTKTADTRLNELLDDLREAGLTPKALKSFRQDYQRTQAEKPREAAPEKTAQPASDPKAPVKPKASDFEGKPWSEYEEAKDKYFEELAQYKASKAVDDDRSARAAEAQSKELQDRVTDAEKRYGKETRQTIQNTATTIFTDANVPPAVKAMVNDSPVMVDLLYVMGSKPEDLADFMESARSNGSAAIRKLVLIEQLVIQELKGGAKQETADRAPDGKFKPQTPEPKITQAPPPPHEVSGRSGQPPDEVAAAVKQSDFRAFKEAQNRRDMNRRKGT